MAGIHNNIDHVVTEDYLIHKENYFHKLNEEYEFGFQSKKLEGLDGAPSYEYIRLIGADRSADTNPAPAMRGAVQKAVMALWTAKINFNMVFRYDGTELGVFFGTRMDDIDTLRDILSGSVMGAEFGVGISSDMFSSREVQAGINGRTGFFVGDPCVREYDKTAKDLSPIDELISGVNGTKWLICIYAINLPYDDIQKERSYWLEKMAESTRFSDISFNYSSVGTNRGINLTEKYPQAQIWAEISKANYDVRNEAIQCGMWSISALCISSRADIMGGIFSAQMKSGQDTIKRPFPFEYRSGLSSYDISRQPSESSGTTITSRELAQLCMLPVRDTCGFRSSERVDFDIDRRNNGGLVVGNIVNGTNITTATYNCEVGSLNRHTLVIGLTGGGKTNTVKTLLFSFSRLSIPFLVIEPAKKEYYEIYNMGMNDMRIFSVGSDEGELLYINPFEPANDKVSLQSHIDAVFAAFKASFIMYTPMPYVLENAIYSIYDDYGWDPSTGHNRFGKREYPTLEDLYYKIETTVDNMGYDEKMRKDLIGSITARINSLRIGAKGKTLNVAHSVDMRTLLEGKCVIELDDVNDEDAKAFIISLLLLRVREYRKAQETLQLELRHILLIEEAHRLLKNVSSGTGENADPRGNAVEYFCNMLAELRSKGQGFIVIDQSPSKLAPDLIKNTNMKIIHRTVAEEDRHLVGGAMNMTEAQKNYLSCLKQGYATVYSEGDYHPKIVKLPYAVDYERSKLSREQILETVKRAHPQAIPSANQIDQAQVNPICRHCRECADIMCPKKHIKKAFFSASEEAEKAYTKIKLTEAYQLMKEICGGDKDFLRCMFAAWFADKNVPEYTAYARSIEVAVKEIWGYWYSQKPL